MTRAAQRLAMTPSAVSHAIGRLRHVVGDELFVKTPMGVRPTPRAQELWQTIDKPIRILRAALSRNRFDPSSAVFSATLSLNDMLSQLLAPAIYAHFAACAPGLQLGFRQRRPLEDEHRIANGLLDVAIGVTLTNAKNLRYRELWQDHYQCLVRRDHPAEDTLAASVSEFVGRPHISVMPDGETLTNADLALQDLGLTPERRIVVAAFSSVADLLVRSDALALLPSSYARHICANDPRVLAIAPPVAMGPLTYSLIWHERLERHEARHWMLQELIRFLSGHLMDHLSLEVLTR